MLRRIVLAAFGAAFAIAVVAGSTGPAHAQISVDIGIHLGSPPPLVAVPDTPVQYAPSVNGNFFFYEGAYYVYQRGAWYSARRHDGPWHVVAPEYVPRPLLAVPVHYYRVPPAEWKRWRAEAPPHWQPAYGRRWEGHHEVMREEHREVHHEEEHR
ncbi:MAG TPA: hypothetical protein VMI34_07940 [Candidatus Bathyarchaeia archaeon]|nr:hypothetical protein [Candidatus Bathyarchaeia archaeon]